MKTKSKQKAVPRPSLAELRADMPTAHAARRIIVQRDTRPAVILHPVAVCARMPHPIVSP